MADWENRVLKRQRAHGNASAEDDVPTIDVGREEKMTHLKINEWVDRQ